MLLYENQTLKHQIDTIRMLMENELKAEICTKGVTWFREEYSILSLVHLYGNCLRILFFKLNVRVDSNR